MRPWLLAECTLTEVRERPPEVVILPFGATEPHNLHLPYSTDTIEADTIAERVAHLAHERGAAVLALPTIPYGTESNMNQFPLAMNLKPSTVLSVLADLVESLELTGVRKCLILNSHGGNEFKSMLRELYDTTDVQLFLCNWYTMLRDQYHEVFAKADDHAGEMETSLILAARPELVHLARADAGKTRKSRFEAVERGWVTITRPWHLLTTNSGSADPRAATAEKGERWLELVTSHLADFVVELAAAPIDGHFPFQE